MESKLPMLSLIVKYYILVPGLFLLIPSDLTVQRMFYVESY